MKKEKKKNYKKIILKIVAAVLGIYLIGLINPLTGPSLRLPYYTLYCGKKPVIASDFAGDYVTEDMGKVYYRADYNDKFYCSEAEAIKAGYQRSNLPRK